MAKREDLEGLLDVAKALSDPTRVRALAALRAGELCVCQLVELLELAPSTVSRHLSLLRRAGLVRARKDGRWVHYRRPGEAGPEGPEGTESPEGPEWTGGVLRALALVDAALEHDSTVAADRERLRTILGIDPVVLCCRQREAQRPGAPGTNGEPGARLAEVAR